MLLTSKNLYGPPSGHGVASVCANVFHSELFSIRLLENIKRGVHVSLINKPDSFADSVSKNLAKQCSSESCVASLQSGIEYGRYFKAEWVIGNKHLKRCLADIVNAIIELQPELVKKRTKIITELKEGVLISFQETLPHVVPLRDGSALLTLLSDTYRHLGMLETKHKKLKFMYAYSNHDSIQRHLPGIAKLISALPDPPAFVKRSTDRQYIGQRFRKHLLHFLSEKIAGNEDPSLAEKTSRFFMGMFSSSDIELYWHPEYDNDLTLIASVWNACRDKEVRLKVITCPDYSGYIDGSGVWNFDFLELGTGEGVVAKKSYALTTLIYKQLSEVGVRVRLAHYLPFFEFKNGFTGKVHLTLAEVRGRLEQSLAAIKNYYEKLGIPAQVGTTEEELPNDEFFERVQKTRPQLKTDFSNEKLFLSFFQQTLSKRYGIYAKWHPKAPEENEEAYQGSLTEKLWDQLAEYFIETSFLNDGKTIMIFADSPQMSQVYPFWNIPAFCGHGKGSLQYAG